MILPNDATVAVLDGRKMHLFRNRGHEPTIDLVALPDPEIARGHAGSGGRHRNSTANPDSRRLEEDDFAAAAADFLNRSEQAGQTGKLLIVADARTLGEMRRHFSQTLVENLLGEIAKDLTAHSKKDIETAIRAV